jgi:steroid 5-alpha reductase family enzyme
MSYVEVFLASAGAIAVLMVGTWLVSIPLRNVSIVDIVWGLGFVVVAWVAYVVGDGVPERRLLLAALTTVWGGRLALYLLWRNAGKGEDPRYVAMRRRRGDAFAVQSLWLVFGLQGVVMFVVSLPVQVGSVPDQPDVGAIEVVGVAVWAVGLFFEAVGDWQLARFKADPANEGQVMDRGLWSLTRHPNYFGDFCVWWGIWIVAAATGVGLYAVVGPIVMTFFLLRVSGVAMLERTIGKRRPGYDAYVARTNTFFPAPPKAGEQAQPPRLTQPGSR